MSSSLRYQINEPNNDSRWMMAIETDVMRMRFSEQLNSIVYKQHVTSCSIDGAMRKRCDSFKQVFFIRVFFDSHGERYVGITQCGLCLIISPPTKLTRSRRFLCYKQTASSLSFFGCERNESVIALFQSLFERYSPSTGNFGLFITHGDCFFLSFLLFLSRMLTLSFSRVVCFSFFLLFVSLFLFFFLQISASPSFCLSYSNRFTSRSKSCNSPLSFYLYADRSLSLFLSARHLFCSRYHFEGD